MGHVGDAGAGTRDPARPISPSPPTPYHPAMLKTPKRVVPATLVLCVLAAFMLALGARMAIPPAVVAVVDLEKVFGGLSQRVVMEEALKARVDDAQKKLDVMQAQLTALDKDIKIMGDVPEKKAKVAERARLFANARVEMEVSKQLLAIEEGDMARDLYNSIDAACEAIAKKNGYHMVLASDETAAIPEGVVKKDVDRFASAKKMMYVDPQLDITAEVITYMNNQYKANVPAGGNAGGSGAKKTP